MKRGVLTVLSGFSGSGKGTIIKKLLSVHPDTYALSVSATTRQKRMNEKTGVFEQDGVDYFFLTKEEFEKRIVEDRFIEYATYNENYYGTPKDYVFECLDKGLDVILEIEVQGALQIKEKFPDALLIFMTPPDAETLYQRLIGRGTETEDVVRRRMKTAIFESSLMDRYDYVLVNDTIDECAEKMHQMVTLAHDRAVCSTKLIDEIKKQLNTFSFD
ncbi:MAG: guanylate kinase [Lachnospiraceae bacterium]|nr:guanylate kinase [Lachnospiraceae bacterium]